MPTNEKSKQENVVALQEKSEKMDHVKEKTVQELKQTSDINQKLQDIKLAEEKLVSESKYQAAHLKRLNDKYNSLIKQGNQLEELTHSKIEQITEQLDEARQQLTEQYQKLADKLQGFDEQSSILQKSLQEKFDQYDDGLQTKLEELKQQIKQNNQDILQQHRKLSSEHLTLTEKTTSLVDVVQSLTEEFEENQSENIASLRYLEEQLEEQTSAHSKALADSIEQQDSKVNKVAESLSNLIAEMDKKYAIISKDMNNELAKMHSSFSQKFDHQQFVNDSLKATDDELYKRTNQLISQDAELNQKTDSLQSTTNKLQQQTAQLEQAIEKLFSKNEKIEEEQKTLAARILANANIESRHFKTLSFSLVALLLLGAVSFYYNDAQKQKQFAELAKTDLVIKQELQQQSEHLTNQGKHLEEKISALSKELDKHTEVATSEVEKVNRKNAHLQHQVAALQVQSKDIDDNISYINGTLLGPFSSKALNGSSTKLYGKLWLLNKAKDHVAIHLYTAAKKQDLFKYIERWGYYLESDLAYYHNQQGYQLLMGDYQNIEQAKEVLKFLPYPVIRQAKGISDFASLQKEINP